MLSTAPAWFEAFYRGAMSEDYKRYMRDEWGHPKRGDVSLFEKHYSRRRAGGALVGAYFE